MGAATAKAAGYGADVTNPPPSAGGAGGKGQSEWGADYIRQAILGGDRALSRGIDWGREVIGGARGRVGNDYDLSGIGEAALSSVDSDRMQKISDMLNDRTQMLGGAFGAFSDGIAAAVDAAVTGSDSIGRAFLKASAAALKALAIESTVRALYNTAMGFAAAANPLTAATAPGYFASAKVFAATAALAGVGAVGLGAAAGGGGGSYGGGGPSSQPGGGNFTGSRAQAAGPQSITVNLYGTIAAGSKREVSEEVASAVDRARRLGTSRSEQTITVRRE
jgi:hypothetical protein